MTPSCKWPIPDYFRFTKTNEEIRPLPTVSEEPSKQLTVFSSETVNIKKLANSANTKNYGQITLNTKPHSDPHYRLHLSSTEIKTTITFAALPLLAGNFFLAHKSQDSENTLNFFSNFQVITISITEALQLLG